MRDANAMGKGLSRRELLGAMAGAAAAPARAPGRPPNLVFILTDNHGAWTLGCYGNRDVRTPNIDRLAREGVAFDRAFAVNPVCSPTRASLLTGLMPSQHGVHRALGGRGAQMGPGAYNTIGEFDSLPVLLTRAGYVAGLTGKWHLGGNLTPQSGFTYWITKPHGDSAGFYNQEVIEDGKVRVHPGYLTDLWTDRAVSFIEQNREGPFFLYLPYNGPYGLGGAATEPIRNRHAAYYASHEMPSFPRDAPHPWCYNYAKWMKNPDVRRKYAAEISGIDDGVGRVLETLTRLNLDRDTLVLFSGDQGLAGGQSGFWGMGDHTRPLTAFDWGTSVPMIFRHTGRIPAGRRSDIMVSSCDVLPTVMTHLGLERSLPATPVPSGRNFAPVLRGETMNWENVTYFEFENVRAIRTAEWKYVERIYEAPNELYDLRSDPGERLNLYGREDLRGVQEGLRKRLYAFFDRHADPKWDLWKGGTSKSRLMTARLFGIKEIREGRLP